MVNHIELAECEFQRYLPVLKELYPNERSNKETLKKLVESYQDMMFPDNIIVGLYDERKMSVFFLSNNFQKITGYKPSTILNWKSLVLFRTLHYSHISYPINTLKSNVKFYKKLEVEELKNASLYSGGLKLVHKNGQIRRAFLKSKRLTWTENNQPDISVIFGEDVTHLMKGNNYWLQYQTNFRNFTYIRQRGKREFANLVSESELKVLKLLADKKTNTEIADELNLSKLTVETHRKNMIKRVGAVNSTALVYLCKMANII